MNKKYKKRTTNIYFAFIILFLVISARIFYLQVFRSNFFQGLAQDQRYRLVKLQGRRGDILDRRKRILSKSISCYSVFADPFLISNSEATADILSTNLDLFKDSLLFKLNKKKRFVWVKRKISWEEKEKVKAFKLDGVSFIRDEKRFYPQTNLLASVLGIVNIDNQGLEGLEFFYNDYLRGKDGWVRVLRDSVSREIIFSPQIISPQEGANIVLSIDAQIQYWVEEYLEETITDFKAASGSALVMNALNGELLALANYPSFNPNELGKILPEQMRNRAVSDMFEPGSVFKIVTLLAAVNEDKFTDQDKIFCENGKLKIPGTILHDWKSYGELSFREVFMKSSNIGVAKIVQALGPDVFSSYLKRLELGRLTGVDLPAEAKGSAKEMDKWSKTSPYIIPIGQEIGVNLLQLARTFAVVANGGYLVTPHVATSICSQGSCESISPKTRKKVIPTFAANRAKDILISVVSEGTGKRAQVKGRKIGGKTGTAQKYDPEIKKYSPSKYRATFVGFIADSNPPLVIGVTVDEPRRSHFGGVVAAPVFKRIAQKVISYTEGLGN
ncbi:MAG: penicillin-binding protein 2 [Candidatus Omnitrophica bacterium]|nr:penicillin-binding protein 2 [Candidatus Omnitrophota bacterium]